MVERAKILFPLSQIGAVTEGQRGQIIKQSRIYGKYDKVVDRESAFEVLMAIIGSCVLPSRWIGGTAFIPILMYDGTRGFAKGKWIKYAFYTFYPLHLFFIYLFRCAILK